MSTAQLYTLPHRRCAAHLQSLTAHRDWAPSDGGAVHPHGGCEVVCIRRKWGLFASTNRETANDF